MLTRRWEISVDATWLITSRRQTDLDRQTLGLQGANWWTSNGRLTVRQLNVCCTPEWNTPITLDDRQPGNLIWHPPTAAAAAAAATHGLIIIKPHPDVAYCYRCSSVVCLYAVTTVSPTKTGKKNRSRCHFGDRLTWCTLRHLANTTDRSARKWRCYLLLSQTLFLQYSAFIRG